MRGMGAPSFIDFLKRKVAVKRVLGLRLVDGSLSGDPLEIRGMFSFHFQNTFTPYTLPDEVVATRDAYCNVVSCKVSCRDRDRLDRDFSREELYVALSSMHNSKSSVLDGLPCEFFKAMRDTIGDDLFSLAFEVFAFGGVSYFLNQGLLKFFPKNTVRDSISGWQSITLLTVAYKIMAKALAFGI
jgi:hypothetical protein